MASHARRVLIASASVLALLAAPAAHATAPPSFDRSFEPRSPGATGRVQSALAIEARVASTDPRSGAPSFVWGRLDRPPAGPYSLEDAARFHLRAHASVYGLTDEALDAARVVHVHDTGRGGSIVVFRQEIGGVIVLSHDAKVLMRPDGALVAIGGALRGDAVPGSRAPFALPYEGAIARALSDLYAISVPVRVLTPSARSRQGDYRRFDLAAFGGLSFDQPARARRVYFSRAGRLVPAYQVEVFARRGSGPWDAYAYVIDAADGSLLQRRNLTADATFDYRVFAEPTGDKRPLDGPVADFTPHPAGGPDGSYPAFVTPELVTIDGFNAFADPWLAAGATESRGNNVDAYTDHDDSGGVSGGDTRATVTAPGVLDHVYDPALDPLASVEQQMAAVTQVFYTTNWLHDYWYDSGFDEAAGNAQLDNYGRGGEDGDALRCEAQDATDAGASNNANMATPGDGASPRMQMYLWDGPQSSSLAIDTLAQTLATGVADFGPGSFDLTATIALVDDGAPPVTDACEAIVSDVAGRIALVDRGTCTFEAKALGAQAAGAVGIIIANNQGGPPPNMPGGGLGGVTIPVLSITQADGNALEAAIAGGTTTGVMQRESGARADGTIDNLVVAHEWGHFIHHRLVDCGLNQCGGESEGWGDFLALHLALRESDDLDGTFSAAVYAKIGEADGAYFGTRRFPYTTDLSRNPLTFQHIQASADLPTGAPTSPGVPYNPEVHNTGEVWASMLFEGFVSLLEQSKLATPRYSFDEARRRMADYVVAGMKLAPAEPTFTEQRDAILAAAFAADAEDALLLAEGFAKRGAGSCAVSPPKGSFDNEGVVESFVVAPAVSVTAVSLDDGAVPCDGDGILDEGEVGTVTVSLANGGLLPAPGTTLTLSSPTPGVSFPDGAEVDLDTLDAFEQIDVTFAIETGDLDGPAVVEIVATAENPAACNPSVIVALVPRVNYDNAPESSSSDDFESDLEVWTPEGEASELIWAREAEADGNHVWHGVDYSSLSDTALVSPELVVSASEPLVLSFSHRYKFETSLQDPGDPDSLVFWDGSVIEVSTDGGLSWDDISDHVDPGYTGQIGNLAENPLSDREGYVGESDDYPALQAVSLDFGDALAGETVQFRFRIGSDQAASEIGWELDDVSFTGVEGTPFPSVVPDGQTCSGDDRPPVADAGPDQDVAAGAEVTLDASGSADPDGDELTFSWSQVEGPTVELDGEGPIVSFDAPDVTEDTALTFEIEVTANGSTATDSVTVRVQPVADEDVAGGCDCAVGRPGGGRASLAGVGCLLALGLLRRPARGRRRRVNPPQ